MKINFLINKLICENNFFYLTLNNKFNEDILNKKIIKIFNKVNKEINKDDFLSLKNFKKELDIHQKGRYFLSTINIKEKLEDIEDIRYLNNLLIEIKNNFKNLFDDILSIDRINFLKNFKKELDNKNLEKDLENILNKLKIFYKLDHLPQSINIFLTYNFLEYSISGFTFSKIPNNINISICKNNTYQDFLDVFIHEFCHILLSCSSIDKEFYNYYQKNYKNKKIKGNFTMRIFLDECITYSISNNKNNYFTYLNKINNIKKDKEGLKKEDERIDLLEKDIINKKLELNNQFLICSKKTKELTFKYLDEEKPIDEYYIQEIFKVVDNVLEKSGMYL